MSKGTVNKVILIGNLGRDPEVKSTPGGLTIANFSVATTETKKDKTAGTSAEVVEWHNINMFGKLAEIAQQYLKKGMKVYLEGKLQTQKWLDKTTNLEKSKVVILCDTMQMLSKGGENSTEEPKSEVVKNNTDFFDDSIPF